MSLKKQLERYKKHLKHTAEMESPEISAAVNDLPSSTPVEKEPLLNEALQEAAMGLDATVKEFEDQAMLLKESVYPLSTKHGLYTFHEIYNAVDLWQEHYSQHPLSSHGLAAEDLLFFDTETTGLGAGAGHMIFLLGAGRIIGSDLQVKQYFLPGPGHETAFYYYFLKDCQTLSNLVTFNGKAFDWPRVKTRVQFVRDRVPKLPDFGHFDLLHASRRLWKQELESVRLSTIEEKKLNLGRDLDVPGHMAPFLYFQFLKSPKASLVEGVFEHNCEDILTLVTLYIHLSKLLHQKVEGTAMEQYQCCRWLFQLGFYGEARSWLEAHLEKVQMNKEEHAHWIELLAYTYKKEHLLDKAHHLFEQLVLNDWSCNYKLSEEVAKYYEHQKKDYEKALFFTKKAQMFFDKTVSLKGNAREHEQEALQHRLDRLLSKNVL
ncbi:ribonuclease H-like domain-containing protein [Pullulanibacillus sp. KACC 23026]|uniref:ribonuclease H-like domain-containing protein n=1 Tax=Pullulanibacillus sp. KACC 23026 TaxID=3028315 RepID=UPI0023B02E1D|nr:ribonuclease H-like domain-containing protein [Pullulanibacillus sp. KACC 23026]WEG10782.1 ribonuclease H-like domain-containing protein [Pullulanibacillus sp. KACC 23026]